MAYPALLWLSAGCALLGSLQFGYHIAVLNTSLEFAAADLGFDAATRGAVVVSAVLVGACVGALGAGWLADAAGPKRAALFNTAPLALGSVLAAVAGTQGTLIAGRLLAGVGVGAASVCAPRYLNEISPTAIRGLLGTMHQIMINVGIVIAFSLGWPYEGGPYCPALWGREVSWWRVMEAAAALPALLQALGLVFCPESPVWLQWTGQQFQAAACYQRLCGLPSLTEAEVALAGSSDAEQPLLHDASGIAESAAAANSADGTAGSAGSFRQLLAPQYRRVMLLAAGLPVLQQFGGINTVLLYGSQVFKMAGVASPVLANVIMGAFNLAATLVAALLMDRAGRKALLTFSFAGMAASLALMAAFLLLPTPAKVAAPAAFACIMLYTLFFAAGCGPIPWLYMSEVLPASIKGPAQSSCTAVNWLANLTVGLSFPAMLRVLGLGGSYSVYAVLCACAAAFCRRFMVETKRRPLGEVHAELMGRSG